VTAVLPVAEPAEPVLSRPRRVRTRPRWPGILSFVLAGVTLAGLVTGIALATSDLFLAATYTAWAAIGASVLAVLAAVVALVGRFGSGWAAAGLILGVIANPLVLTMALDLIGGLWA
jgi:hypothetical protein